MKSKVQKYNYRFMWKQCLCKYPVYEWKEAIKIIQLLCSDRERESCDGVKKCFATTKSLGIFRKLWSRYGMFAVFSIKKQVNIIILLSLEHAKLSEIHVTLIQEDDIVGRLSKAAKRRGIRLG